MGFYGNNIITHIPRSHFDIALTVANRKALDSPEVLEQLDIYDYVLVHYGDTESERQTNYAIDTANGFTYNYHNTIWQKGYKLVNADITVIAQAPKLAPHIPEMRKNIASVLEMDVSDINVKATTTEKLGFTGRKEGISSYAVCIINKR